MSDNFKTQMPCMDLDIIVSLPNQTSQQILNSLTTYVELWNLATIHILDCPGEQFLFEYRIYLIQKKLEKKNKNIKLAEFKKCTGKEEVKNLQRYILLRKPNSYYYDRESLLKVEKNKNLQ
jgi:hypothetical protein